ncbi:MAG: HoxN/HupN/NixA family nickel/cobalt transporter [Methylophilus sp.]|jgi:high-affinity nickel-transport protein
MRYTLKTASAEAHSTYLRHKGLNQGFLPRFTLAEWRRLLVFYGFIAGLHLLGLGLFIYYAAQYPAMLGLGFAAYLFGLRHAFDADHIAAVDDTVRYLMQKGQTPLGVGFFFSLGHSSVVFILSLVLALAAGWLKTSMPMLQHYGGLIGASVSGSFLWLIGILNLLLLLDMLKIWQQAKSGLHSHTHIDELLSKRGLMNRIFGGRLKQGIAKSWHMYPLGFMFGLGFDTASEIGLLAMTAGAASGNLPIGAVLSMPILFAAGMSLMDTTDGVLMVKAYHWAFVNPLRKIFYNISTTCFSIAIALIIGSVELLQVAIHIFNLKGNFYAAIAAIDFAALGYVIVAVFILTWLISAILWKLKKIDQIKEQVAAHTHEHTHKVGGSHIHNHFH